MITLTREEAQQVLECMETAIKAGDWVVDGACDPDFILYLLRARLAQPEPEPVAWFTEDHREDKSATTYSKKMAERWKEKGWPVTPLYTTPPQRKDIYEEGCTPTDFRVLREANARMAQELFELRSKK